MCPSFRTLIDEKRGKLGFSQQKKVVSIPNAHLLQTFAIVSFAVVMFFVFVVRFLRCWRFTLSFSHGKQQKHFCIAHFKPCWCWYCSYCCCWWNFYCCCCCYGCYSSYWISYFAIVVMRKPHRSHYNARLLVNFFRWDLFELMFFSPNRIYFCFATWFQRIPTSDKPCE